MIFCRFIFFLVVVSAEQPIGLRVIGSLRGLLLGTAAGVNNLRNEIDSGGYNQKLKENYQLIVAENELKPDSIWLGENLYDWTKPDWLLGSQPNTTGWIQQNGMILRGHNLVWPPDACTPNWLLRDEASITPEKAKGLLSDYIHAVVGRYRGKIPWWDVVNEAIDDENNTRPLNLRDGFWFRKLGPDFLKYAFTFAREADPEVKLYYNEYGIEHLGLKATRVLALIGWLRSEGCTVDGIGLQWHIDVSRMITPGDTHYQSAQASEIGGPRDLSRPVPSCPVPGRDGMRKSRSKAGWDGTIFIPAGRRTGRDSFSECGTGHAITTFLLIPRRHVTAISYDNEIYRVALSIV